MTSSVRLADRLLTALTGLVLLVGALWLIGDRALVPVARQASDRIDPQAIARSPQWPWWSAALACVGLALLLFGLWVVLAHVRPAASRLGAASRAPIALDRIAAAAAADVARHPQVHRARAAIRVEGRAPVMRIIAELPPHTSPSDITRLARRCRADAHAAAGSDVDVQFVVKHIGPDRADAALL